MDSGADRDVQPCRSMRWLSLVLVAFTGSAHAQTILSSNRSTPHPGVEVRSGNVRLTNGATSAYDAVYTSLCTDYVHVTATAPATSPRTTSSWASSAGVQVAQNGDFFRTTSGNWHVYGDAVGNGRRWPAANTGNPYTSGWFHHNYGWIAFGPGWVDYSHTEYVKNNPELGATGGWRPGELTEDIPGGTIALVSGFSELVIEGVPYACPDALGNCFPDRGDMSERHRRSAMGITEDRNTFIMATVDGGTLGAELAQIMFDLGAWQAFNIDGGGSSGLWVQGSGYINAGSSRAVMNHWGVYAGSGGGRSADPGSCFVEGGCYPVAVSGAEAETFKDLSPEMLGYAEADILFRAGVTNGCQSAPERMFCPRCDTTRRTFIVMLVRAAGIETPAVSSSSFTDVADDDWALPYIEAAASAGIIAGCGDGLFCPGDPVTRGQAAAFITRAAGWGGTPPATPTFDDVPTDHLFFRAIEQLSTQCVTNGCGDGNYCPARAMTRAEVAIFLARAFNLEGINECMTVPGEDAGMSMPDGGPGFDGGPDFDGGRSVDAAGSDTGTGEDAGMTEPLSDGCGCRTTSRGDALLPLLALLWLRRRDSARQF